MQSDGRLTGGRVTALSAIWHDVTGGKRLGCSAMLSERFEGTPPEALRPDSVEKVFVGKLDRYSHHEK